MRAHVAGAGCLLPNRAHDRLDRDRVRLGNRGVWRLLRHLVKERPELGWLAAPPPLATTIRIVQSTFSRKCEPSAAQRRLRFDDGQQRLGGVRQRAFAAVN